MGGDKVDIIDLVGIPPEWQRDHRIRAIRIAGTCRVESELAHLQREHPEDFKKLQVTMALVGKNKRVLSERHVKRSRRHEAIYEMRGGDARLFFFYSEDGKEIVVCTNSYWKAKPSRAEQNEAIDKAERLRQRYLKSRAT